VSEMMLAIGGDAALLAAAGDALEVPRLSAVCSSSAWI